MNRLLLATKVQEFIITYSKDLSQLAFSGSPFKNISTQALLQQIESRKKVEKKLPLWFCTKNIYYPPKLNLEQTSSEQTAKYKASLVSGDRVLDLTGGFGVDSYYFAETFNHVDHFEQNKLLSTIASYNFSVFNKNNILCSAGDGFELLNNKKYDLIYIDPSRRNATKGKVFYLTDCTPCVPDNLEFLFKHSKQILIKTSPMLDITIGLEELKFVKEVHIVAVKNEVKELLFLVEDTYKGNPRIKTINITNTNKQIFNFNWQEESTPTYSSPKTYLYEPNTAILKSGAFFLVSEKYNVAKLHPHSHLYTSKALVPFPGRIFKIIRIHSYQKKELKKIKIHKANITTRNFPESVSQLRKKLKIKDGGTDYLFFTTDSNHNKIVLVCTKV